MKKLFQLLVLLLPLGIVAQEKGVHFEHELSWKEVQAKAKAENKYIFMDCFTTWCGPCKYMTANVFPQEKMGDFFNKNFINVKVQMDQTDKDNEQIKKWYEDAKAINTAYAVNAYPSFLYFSPDGKLVHRVVGSAEADAFIVSSSAALDPAKQSYTLLEQFKNKTDKTPEDIRKMALSCLEGYDNENANLFATQYLATQKDLLTRENLQFISNFTDSSNDKGFDIFLHHADKVDAELGKGAAAKKVKQIILQEEVYPKIPKSKDGPAPDWKAMQQSIAKKYPAYADEVVSGMKVQYLHFKKDWPGFQTAVTGYMKKYGEQATADELNTFAWAVFQNCPDMKCVGDALEWSKRSFKDIQDPMYMDTYANLLYKMGKKEEAITWEEKAMKLANDDKTFQATIDKMKKGEKTWDN